jgi:AcrR family transcriptional regulator
MDTPREDRRVRRTRRLLQEALLALILEKGYDQVTIQDLLGRADVGRATFYAHFRDKDDLLLSGSADVQASLRYHLAEAAKRGGDGSAGGLDLGRALFEHAARHRRLYRALIGSRAVGVVLKYASQQLATLLHEHLDEVFASRSVSPTVPLDVTVQYLASALLGTLMWWFDNDMPYPPDQMGRIFLRLARPAVTAALGESALRSQASTQTEAGLA